MTDRSPQIRVTAMPAHTNTYGGVFGGWLMALPALRAALRHLSYFAPHCHAARHEPPLSLCLEPVLSTLASGAGFCAQDCVTRVPYSLPE